MDYRFIYACQTYFIVIFPKRQAVRKRREGITSTQKVMCRIWEWNLERKSWFAKFGSGDFSLKNGHLKLMRPVSRQLLIQIVIAHVRLQRMYRRHAFKKIKTFWLPHKLKKINLMQRISNCDSLLKLNKINPFLKRLITGDEKWIVFKRR